MHGRIEVDSHHRLNTVRLGSIGGWPCTVDAGELCERECDPLAKEDQPALRRQSVYIVYMTLSIGMTSCVSQNSERYPRIFGTVSPDLSGITRPRQFVGFTLMPRGIPDQKRKMTRDVNSLLGV